MFDDDIPPRRPEVKLKRGGSSASTGTGSAPDLEFASAQHAHGGVSHGVGHTGASSTTCDPVETPSLLDRLWSCLTRLLRALVCVVSFFSSLFTVVTALTDFLAQFIWGCCGCFPSVAGIGRCVYAFIPQIFNVSCEELCCTWHGAGFILIALTPPLAFLKLGMGATAYNDVLIFGAAYFSFVFRNWSCLAPLLIFSFFGGLTALVELTVDRPPCRLPGVVGGSSSDRRRRGPPYDGRTYNDPRPSYSHDRQRLEGLPFCSDAMVPFLQEPTGRDIVLMLSFVHCWVLCSASWVLQWEVDGIDFYAGAETELAFLRRGPSCYKLPFTGLLCKNLSGGD